MKRVLAIMGSPRKNKNTDNLLDMVIKGIKEKDAQVNKFYLSNLSISHCTACGFCEKSGQCVFKDDMDIFYNEFNKSDGIIVASPLYFNNVSSLTKGMIDRCQMFWSSKYVLKKPTIDVNKKRVGMFICVAGSTVEGQFDGCKLVMDLFFKAINTKYKLNLLVSDTDAIPVWERDNILHKAYQLGKKFFD